MAEEGETPELELKVAEAVQDDVHKGIVRIDSSMMKQIDVSPGDIVEIEGNRNTVAIADRSYPGDLGLDIVRMDGICRRNAKTSIGEQVKIRKADVEEAEEVTIAPAREGVVVKGNPKVFKQGLLGRSVKKGDIVSLGGSRRRRTATSDNPLFEDMFNIMDENMLGFGFGDLKFVVAKSNPNDKPVIITEETEVNFNPKAMDVEEETTIEVSYEDIGGLEEEIDKVREMVELPLNHPEIFERLGIEPPKGVMLHGPPGTGKTMIAKAVASETNSNFISINGPEIMSKYYGQSEENLRKKFEEAEENSPSIIFIDEIDAIASKREETRGEVERRVVAQLLSLMDGLENRGEVIVLAATNRPDAVDPALRRAGRFDREIEIGIPDREGREDILKIHTRGMPLSEDLDLNEIAKITHGFVGADLAALSKESAMVVLRRMLPEIKIDEEENIPQETLEELKVTMDDFKEALKMVNPSAMREVRVEVPDTTWDDVGGLSNVREELSEAAEWPLNNPEAFERMGVTPPKGVLLYGAPGTGKTLMAKAVASESDANFILVNGPSLLSKYVGESEKAVREIFRKARQTAPTIIFFDEIDSLAPKRGQGDNSNQSTERVVNQILTELDGLQELHDVVVIAATNRPDMVDSALLRPGRFDRIIQTPVPDKEARKKIFQVHTEKMPIDDNEIDLEELAEETENYTGADIESVCREASIMALREDIEAEKVKEEHFEKALEKVTPSATEDIEEMYENMKKHFKRARAEEMEENKPGYFG